jgi:hypothetical protein
MLLTAVHVSTQPCRDTITFDFTSSASEQPGYRVSYEPGPFTQDASGKPVTITGKAFLVVRLEPATGFDFNNNRETYTGPDRVPTPGTKWVEDLVRTGDFESVTTWVIGVNKRVQFTATGTGAPNHRLTITLGT